MTRTRFAAIALALGVVCSGCSDDDPKPQGSPSQSTSPGPTVTKSTSEPPEPEPLDPKETVRAWVEARNVTVRTGNAKAVYALSTRTCESCSNSIEPIREVYSEGGRLETSGWRVKSVEKRPDFSSTGNVAAAIVFAAGRTFPSENAEPIVYEEEKRILVFTLAQVGDLWKIDHFAYAS